MAEFLLIDGSYYIFYRYYALLQWWKHALPEEELGNPCENAEFMERFKKVFISKKEEIIKKLKLTNPMIMVAKDCPRQDIWRCNIYPEYKGSRINDKHIGGIFQRVYGDELFKQMGAHLSICHPKLEADDCIALTVRSLRRLSPDSKIYIITSDMDYLQIADDKTIPINLQYKSLQDSKQSFKNCDKDLFCKIVIGDKSDNIPAVFKKCGIKTAEKYFNDMELFNKKLEEDNEAKEQYILNKKLIDFTSIPLKYIKEFNSAKFTEKLY